MPADWTAIENALHAFVARSAGLVAAKVIWEDQSGPRPQVPFMALDHNANDELGQAEQRQRDADDPEPGADLVLETVVQTEFVLTVQVYGNKPTGAEAAKSRATVVRNALWKESEIEAFDAVGLASVDGGTVQNLTGLLETEFESRALLEIRFRVADGAEELNTWIETVESTGTYND